MKDDTSDEIRNRADHEVSISGVPHKAVQRLPLWRENSLGKTVDSDPIQSDSGKSGFYRNLWVRKLEKLESLRQAQLTMLLHYDAGRKQLRGPGEARPIDARQLEEARTKLSAGRRPSSPFYWAGFVLSADWL